MKILFLQIFILFYYGMVTGQTAGIGTPANGSTAILEINATDKGFLPPRLTLIQRNAIKNPAIGLTIWCIDCDELQIYNGYMWTNVSGMAAGLKAPSHFRICYKNWTTQNLAVRTYRNGDTIPVVTDPSAWANLTTGAMCWFNNDSTANAGNYGALYNWYAVNDPRGLAPMGWHIARTAEWNLISECLGGDSVAGGKMKAVNPLWSAPNTAASNSSGFGGMPSGFRNSSGIFANSGTNGYWWQAEPVNATHGAYRQLQNTSAGFIYSTILKTTGLAVRCVRD